MQIDKRRARGSRQSHAINHPLSDALYSVATAILAGFGGDVAQSAGPLFVAVIVISAIVVAGLSWWPLSGRQKSPLELDPASRRTVRHEDEWLVGVSVDAVLRQPLLAAYEPLRCAVTVSVDGHTHPTVCFWLDGHLDLAIRRAAVAACQRALSAALAGSKS